MISNKQRKQMGIEVYIVLVQAKAILDDYHCEVTERPPMMQHASDCRNHQGCAEDWQSVWWNGMGRLLLDSHNPQPFGEALKCFKCLQFGRVGDTCKDNMFNNVVEINVPSLCSDRFITRSRTTLWRSSYIVHRYETFYFIQHHTHVLSCVQLLSSC